MVAHTQEIRGQWYKLKSKAKERWEQLTDDDLRVPDGNIEQLVDCIRQKTGEGSEVIAEVLSEVTAQGSSAVSHAAEAMGQFAHQAGRRVRERYDGAEEVVRHNPMRSVLATFGIGLVAGLVVGLVLRSR